MVVGVNPAKERVVELGRQMVDPLEEQLRLLQVAELHIVNGGDGVGRGLLLGVADSLGQADERGRFAYQQGNLVRYGSGDVTAVHVSSRQTSSPSRRAVATASSARSTRRRPRLSQMISKGSAPRASGARTGESPRADAQPAGGLDEPNPFRVDSAHHAGEATVVGENGLGEQVGVAQVVGQF